MNGLAFRIFIGFLLLVGTGILSCGKKTQPGIGKRNSESLTYTQLPSEVSSTYLTYFDSDLNSQFVVTDTNSIIISDYHASTVDHPYGNGRLGYYFTINGKFVFIKYQPPKGLPFVIDSNHIYWSTDLNPRKGNCKNILYERKRWSK